MPFLQLLVEVLDREPLIVLLIQRPHALELVRGRTLGRRLADPAIDQAVGPILLVAVPPAAQGPLTDPERRCRLGMAEPAAVPTLQQFLKAHDADPRQPLHPAHPRFKFLGTVPEPDGSRAT